MKLKFILLLMFLICSSLNAQMMDWRLLPGDHFDELKVSSSGSLYAVSELNDKVYKSTDEGFHWTNIYSVNNPTSIELRGDDTIWIGTSSGEIKNTINGGQSFSLLKTFPSKINCIRWEQFSDKELLIVGTESSGVFLSSNEGNTWVNKPFTVKSVRTIEVIWGKIFAGTYNGGMFVSADTGETWIQSIISSSNEVINDIEKAENDSAVYVSSNKLYKSTDRGTTWSIAGNFYSYAVEYSPVENEIFAENYRSRNNGITWQKIFPGVLVKEIKIVDSTTYIINDTGKLYKENHHPYLGNNYSPLSMGNKWQYLHYSYVSGTPSSVTKYYLYTDSVIGDTLLGGETYYKIAGYTDTTYYRYDSTNRLYKYRANGSVLIMNFNLRWGDTFVGELPITGVVEGSASIFGESKYYKGFNYQNFTAEHGQTRYADSIGKYLNETVEDGPMGFYASIGYDLIQAVVKINDSVYQYKDNQTATIQIDAAFIPGDTIFTIGITANHQYDRNGSTPAQSVFFVDSVEIEYFFSQDQDSTETFRKPLYNQPNSNFFMENIYFPDSLFYNLYDINYRLYTKDKGIIPTHSLFPETGYLVFHLDPTGVKSDEIKNISFKLYQNYPNPFNPTTKIRYSIPFAETHRHASQQNVLLKVYDVLGKEIATLVNEEKAPGEYQVQFDAEKYKLASGIYFCRLTAGNKSMSTKMILIK